MEASKQSDIEFKIMVIKKLSKLNENYQKVQGSYKELTANYTSMKKDINYQEESDGNEEYPGRN